MTTERQRLEQAALEQLNRGSAEGALKAYLSILRLDPKDRRVRQKVGDIYLRQGKNQDAERHLREVAEGLLKENAHRAAVSVLKQLASLRPDDPQIQLDLGECYLAGAYQSDARACFDAALRAWMGIGKPLLAAKAAKRLVDATPQDQTARLRVAELLEAGGDIDGASDAYAEVMEEFRRRGRMDEVGRIAELALKGRPEDVGLLLDAAAGRIQQGEFKRALQALQGAFLKAPKEPRTLDLLAQAFEGAGQAERALKVLLELSRVGADRNDIAAEADALRRAAALGPHDTEVAERLALAEDRLGRLERKVTGLQCVEPADEATLRDVVRAEVLVRYGKHAAAEAGLRAAMSGQPDSIALMASLAELLVAAGRVPDALPWMERLVPRAGAEASTILDRMALLRGIDRVEVPAPVNDDDLLDDDLVDDDRPTAPPVARGEPEGATERGDRLHQEGNLAGALTAWREALSEDPLNDAVLVRIAALRNAARAGERVPAAEPDFGAPDDGTFAEVEPDALAGDSWRQGDAATADLERAATLAAAGEFSDARDLARPHPGLAARVVEARCLEALGDPAGSLDMLREATSEAADTDPAYPEAIFDLAGLYSLTQKTRAALRLLEELRDLAPAYRSAEVDVRLRGLKAFGR